MGRREYRAEHTMVTLTGATDASSSGWGGLIGSPGREVFRAGGDFQRTWRVRTLNCRKDTRYSRL